MKFRLKGKAILSPMAGVTDVAFRTLCKQYGAALTYTEFVSSAAIVRGNKNTLRMIRTDPIEKPVGIQLFGSSVEEVVEAARLVEDRFDIIDVNCGCPAWKVVKTGAGSQMLNNPERIGILVNKLASAVNRPVTIKIRSGIDAKHINAVEVAKIAENNGAAAITVHGRTQKQGFSGKADWEIIKKVKENVEIPVIGNGDVTTPEIFKSRLETVDYIMIARAAMSDPYIFRQINDYLETGSYKRKRDFSAYLNLARKYEIPFVTIKNHAMSFTKGFIGGAKIRQKIMRCHDLNDLQKIM